MKDLLSALLVLFLVTPAFAERLSNPMTSMEIATYKVRAARSVMLLGAVDENSAKQVDADFTRLNDTSNDPITFIINSNGGRVDYGIDIIYSMQRSLAPVTCLIVGNALSMGAIIATFCPKLYVLKDSIILFHPYQCVLFDVVRVPCIGPLYDRGLQALDKAIARRLGIELAEYLERKNDPDMWVFDAEDAIMMGFASVLIDEIVFQ